jgi:hypothetical protein
MKGGEGLEKLGDSPLLRIASPSSLTPVIELTVEVTVDSRSADEDIALCVGWL